MVSCWGVINKLYIFESLNLRFGVNRNNYNMEMMLLFNSDSIKRGYVFTFTFLQANLMDFFFFLSLQTSPTLSKKKKRNEKVGTGWYYWLYYSAIKRRTDLIHRASEFFFKEIKTVEKSVEKLNWHYIKLQLFQSFFSLVSVVDFIFSYPSSGLDYFLRSVSPNRNQSIYNAFPFCCLVQAANKLSILLNNIYIILYTHLCPT